MHVIQVVPSLQIGFVDQDEQYSVARAH